MNHKIAEAMRSFQDIQQSKRGLLLTEHGGYFLYDNKFCSLQDFHIRLQSQDCCMNSFAVTRSLFVGSAGKRLLCATTDEQELMVDQMCVMFHIACGEHEEDLMRGIFFARREDAFWALFSDPAIEILFRAMEGDLETRKKQIPPDVQLMDLLEDSRKNDLRLLTALYLIGDPWPR